MAAAGSAVGLGNIWKFPYVTGDSGGAAFLLIYIVCIFLFGLPLVLAELSLGRLSGKSPVAAFRQMGNRGWSGVGGLSVLTAFMVLSFYIVVCGWTLAYMYFELTGEIDGTNQAALQQTFTDFTGGVWAPIICAAVFMIGTAGVILGGVGNGIERVAKILMPILFLLLIILVFRAVTLPGSWEGVKFFLVPDWSRLDGETATAAVGQAFFSLSLGEGVMITYGSYMARRHHLPTDALAIVGLDTLVAILAGLAVLPAMFAAGIEPGNGGPGTTFMVLPAVFAEMPAGWLFGFFFFLLLAIAALTSAISPLEVMVRYLGDEFGLARKKATILSALVSFAVAVPAILSFGPWSGVHILPDSSIFDSLDFTATSIGMPVGGLLTALFLGWVIGPRAFQAIRHPDGRLPIWAGAWLFVLRFITPLGIGWILLSSLIMD